MYMYSRIFSAPIIFSSIYTGLQNRYVKQIEGLFLFLKRKEMNFIASVVATFLIEPLNALYAGYLMNKRLDKQRFSYINPKILNEDQSRCIPVLFIHGDSSNSGLFAPMIDHLNKKTPHTPIFTIDLTSTDGIVSSENHLKLIVDKVKEIADLYLYINCPRISFVGHSSGGDVLAPLAQRMEEEKWAQPVTLIKIGSIFKEFDAANFSRYSDAKVIEIAGKRDVFEGYHSYAPQSFIVDSGHLGLLFNKTVLDHVSNQIS